jgi:hypothetical protein
MKETMKYIKLLIIPIFISITFMACTSKSQTDAINSGSKDISDLLRTLIQKEKEINELNKTLDDCKKNKSVK